MPNQPTDPIISEVRAVRDAHAARFDYDLAAIFRNIRAMQDASGREYVRFPARPVASSDTRHDKNGAKAGGRAAGSR
ncbi:MAG: hypothetical protein F4206_08800 [Gammaproteobacteria bacterium]|nr:hypothetical protein [Gammaproteobacteria bacterium]MYG66806.1 hypothetical protein [Gammaproteobacteria bacterium]